MDSDYALYLSGEYLFQLTNPDTEKKDPQYEIFLNSLKQDGNVWVVQADERNGLDENHCMEDVFDDVLDLDIGRETMNVMEENVEDVRSNFYRPDVGSLRKKQRKAMVEKGMELDCSDPINPNPFLVQLHLDEDPDTAISYTSSMQHNNEKPGGSTENCHGKNVRASAKVNKGGECGSSINVEVSDADYQYFLQNFVCDEGGRSHSLVAVGKYSAKGNPKPLAVPGRSDGGEYDGCICLGSPSEQGNSIFREQLIKILRKPYNKEERRMLAQDMKATKPIRRNLDLRHGREQSYLTDKNGKSYLDYYPDLKRKLEAADPRKELTLLRGFFFWLQNLTQPGAFRPWQDESCLAVQPRNH